jgi:hypothetical protein
MTHVAVYRIFAAVISIILPIPHSSEQLLSSNEETARQVEVELVELYVCTLHFEAN